MAANVHNTPVKVPIYSDGKLKRIVDNSVTTMATVLCDKMSIQELIENRVSSNDTNTMESYFQSTLFYLKYMFATTEKDSFR